MLAEDVIEVARDTLVDPDGVRWTDEQMLVWLGDAQRSAAAIYPAMAAKVAQVLLTAGESRQSIPADGFELIDIPRALLAADGVTPANPVRRIDYDTLRAFDTDWHTESISGTATIYDFAYDKEKERDTFWVSPRTHAVTATYVEMVYAELWANPASMGATLPVNEEYLFALASYIVFRALSVDTDLADAAEANKHIEAFTGSLGALRG